MQNRGDRRGLNPRQLEPQGRSRAKKQSNSKWVPSDDDPPDVRNLPGSDGQSVPGTDIQRPTLAKNASLEGAVSRKSHRWSTAVRVERDGESAFEKKCADCDCIARDVEVWTKTFRAGVLVSGSMRKVWHFKRATDASDRQWRESRPACEVTA